MMRAILLVLACGGIVSAEETTALPESPTATEAATEAQEKPDPLAPLREQIEALELALHLKELERKQATADLTAERERLELDTAIGQARLDAELQEARARSERRRMALDEMQEELHTKQIEQEMRRMDADIAMQDLQLDDLRRQRDEWQAESEVRAMDRRNLAWEKRQQLQALVEHPPERPRQPFADGVLTISDRAIYLDSPIISGSADWVCSRIDFFNNQSGSDPIFIVIGYCPGGSLLEGMRILRSMQASQAPIHVVVKGLAASMAAVLLSNAQHSYAYPDALVLHHQPWSVAWGNVVQQKRDLARLQAWGERLHARTAQRMGMTVAQLWERMYQEDPDGDWMVFGDQAQQLGWIDHTVQEIRETGIIRQPEDADPWTSWWDVAQRGSYEAGPLLLPRPQPGDHYFLWNRNGEFALAP